MASIGVRQLKAQASRVLRRVRERGETIDVTYRGRVIARLVPAEQPSASAEELRAALADLDMEPFLARYWAIDPDEYGALVDREGLDYLTYYLGEVSAFYHRAAQAGWATVFAADQ